MNFEPIKIKKTKQYISITLLLMGLVMSKSYSQPSKETAFTSLGSLVGGTWTYEGTWPNGEPFKQEIICKWGLNKQIIKVQTMGIIDRETKSYGLRNEGIRVWDAKAGKMKFYEFDVYGGITEGYCVFEEGQFHFEYLYEIEGKQETMRDSWRRIDDNTYEFSVNMKVDDGWKTYTTNEYKRIK